VIFRRVGLHQAHVGLRLASGQSKLQRPVHSAEQPAHAKCDSDGSVGLLLDHVAQRALKRAASRLRALPGLPVHVLSGIGNRFGHATRLFLGVAERAVETRGWGRSLIHKSLRYGLIRL
jgi:hypothetical protein